MSSVRQIIKRKQSSVKSDCKRRETKLDEIPKSPEAESTTIKETTIENNSPLIREGSIFGDLVEIPVDQIVIERKSTVRNICL